MSVVWGSGVGVVLHNRSRFDVVGSGMLGLLTKLRERRSLSESLSLGSVNHPRRWAIVRSGSCIQRWSKGLGKLDLCYDLVDLQRKTGSVVRCHRLLLVLIVPLFKAEDFGVRT